MSRIEKIKNVPIFNDLTTTPTAWNTNTNLQFIPDEIIVRQISYNGPPIDGVYMIWSTLINDYIGSFSLSEASGFLSSSVNVTPNTRIQCSPNSTMQSIQFQIHSIDSNSKPISSSDLTGKIIINLDFIAYKK